MYAWSDDYRCDSKSEMEINAICRADLQKKKKKKKKKKTKSIDCEI